MNWTVHGVKKLTQHDLSLADEVCEHVKVGDSVCYIGEQDSFGPVTRFYTCAECEAEGERQRDAELVVCDDCGKDVPRGETIEWKWYDFYAAQGDEPVVVCNECRKADKHLNRVRKDQDDYNAEFGIVDEDDF